MNEHNETKQGEETEQGERTVGTDRRTFVGLAGAAVLGGVTALSASSEAQAQVTAPGTGVRGSLEIKRPAGLGPKAMLDNRFPVSFSESVPKSCEVIMGYVTALNQRDLRGMAEYLHFPFASFEGTDPVLVSTPDQFMSKTPASMNMTLHPERYTDHDGYLKPGCYDVFRGLEVLCMDPIVTAIAMSYDRYDDNGKLLLRCDGVYSITNNDGRWAIQLMSTIFTPAQMIGLEFQEGVMAATQRRINVDLAYQVADHKDSPRQQTGALAAVEMGEAGSFMTAPFGTAMERFKIKGVKSRLQFFPAGFSPLGAPNRDWNAFYADYRKALTRAVGSNWGFVYGLSHDTRVLHQTFNKIHVLAGATRFTAAGEEINYNYDVEVITYKEGYWGGNGAFLCYTTPHDRSNDVFPT